MVFNHYAKLRRLIAEQPPGWYIVRIDQPTSAKKFNGERIEYDHYYRLYSASGEQIPYGKFQKIDRLAQVLGCDQSDLPVVEQR